MKYLYTLIFSFLVCQIGQAQQLVAHYTFELSTNDQSPNQINPTYVGPAIDYGTDRFGRSYGALKFDGNPGSYLRMSADSLPTNNRTVSLWFNATTVATRPQFLAYGGNSPSVPPGTSYLMGLNTSGSSAFQTSAHYNTNVVNFVYQEEPVNQWIHWVVTISGDTTRLFVNGELKRLAPGTFLSQTVVAGKEMALGVMVNSNGIAPYTDVNSGYFSGLLDDVRIYDNALTEQQVKQLYLLESTGLVAYYPFKGNANDESGNRNHGTVNGANLTTDRFGNPGKAYRFNNPNHISVSNSNLFSDEFSVSYWLKIGSYFGDRGVMSNVASPNGGFQQTFNGQTFSCIMGYNFIGGFNPNFFYSNYVMQEPVNSWQHVVVTYKKQGSLNSESKLYVNGEIKKTEYHSLPMAFSPNAPFFIGQNHSGLNFEGDLDDIRIYNRNLNPNEIRQLADEPFLPELLAWLPLNGDARDVSGKNRNGTVYGNAFQAKDRYGNSNSAFFIDGLDAGISLSSSGSLDFVEKPFSLSIWVKYENITGPPSAVVAKHNCGFTNGYVIGIYENVPRFFLASGSDWSMLSAGNPYNDNTWHHLVATYDGVGKQEFFVDGRLQESVNMVYSNPAGAGAPIILGDAAGSCAGGTFQCNLDEFKVYEKNLDSMQVKALFLQSRGSGNALSFLEPSQTLVKMDSLLIGEEFSSEAWVKSTGAEGPQFVFSAENAEGSWSFGLQNEKLLVRRGSETAQTSSTIPVYDNAWHHIAVTVKNNQYKFYFDGMAVGNGSTPIQVSQSTPYFMGQFLNGVLDEVRIWKRELSLEQIRNWMNRKITTGHPAFADLQHYCTFDEPNFGKNFDLRGGRPGLLVNNPQFGPSGAPIGDTAAVSFNLAGTEGVELVSGGDSVKISGWSGSPNGIAIYEVKDVPANPKGIQGLGGNDHYFGTVRYGTGQFLDQLYKYGNNPRVTEAVQPTVALFYRQNNATRQWGPGTEVTHNPATKQFSSNGPSGEWILGSTGIPLTVRDLTSPNSKREWTVFPNPVSETLYVKGFQSQAILTLRDVAGRAVIPPTTLGEKQGLPVSILKPGFYILEIQEGKQRFVAKILITRH